MRKLNWILLTLGAVTLGACTFSGCKKEQGPDEPSTTFDRGALLNDLAQRVFLVRYADLERAATDYRAVVDRFAADPDAGNLSACKTSWNSLMDAWMGCEGLRVGPQYNENLNQRIAYSPVNSNLIESEIAGTGPVDLPYMSNTGVTRKGVYAMEYLLYNSDDATLLQAFTSAPHAERRRMYLASAAGDVQQRVQAIHQAWAATGGNHAQAFAAGTASDIGGSLNLTVNALIEHIEVVRRNKVQIPAGIETGGAPDPSAVECRASGRSLRNIRLAVDLWRALLTSADGTGIDDNLAAVGAQHQGSSLVDRINAELNAATTAIDAIQVPLDVAVINDPATVDALYQALKRLTVLTKVDMASQLGVIITFSDNDGD